MTNLAAGVAFLLLVCPAASAQGPSCQLETLQLSGSDSDQGDRFGRAVAVAGSTMVVGAVKGEIGGAAYVFERIGPNRWTETARLTDEPVTTADRFGQSVAIDGSTVVVGDPEFFPTHTPGPGSVSVFARDAGGPDAWGRVAVLHADDALAGDEFGWSVSLQGDLVVVGAPSRSDKADVSGAAYVFQRQPGDPSMWVQVAKLLPDALIEDHQFGWSVAIDGDRILVGAPSRGPGLVTGSAYVFRRSQVEGGAPSWVLVATLAVPDPITSNDLGTAVDLEGEVAVVTAPGARTECHHGICSAGLAYVFERDLGGPEAWGLRQVIAAPDPDTTDDFGNAAALRGDTLVVGTWHDQVRGYSRGSAYVLRRDPDGEWRLVVKLAAGPTVAFEFGVAVATDGEQAFVGSNARNDEGVLTGAVHVDDIAGPDCNLNGVPDGCDVADGSSRDLDADGVPDECQIDCDENGWTDILDILDSWRLDCDDTRSLDVCDVADGTSPDVNGDLVPDPCEDSDCNRNLVPDIVDVVTGASPDCNANFMPDECEATTGYAWDVGYISGAAVGFADPSPVVWANQFEAGSGAVISGVSAAHIASLDVGDPVTIFVWDDPNDDGQPDDAVLIRTSEGTVETINDTFPPISFDVYTFRPVAVDGSFFVGLGNGTAQYPVAIDVTPAWGRRGWIAAGVGGDAIREAFPIGYGDFMIHAIDLDCNANLVPDACDIADGTLGDANANGIPDPCEGDLDQSGVIDGADLERLISAWGPCGEQPRCASDFDGDGMTGIGDLLILLGSWSQ